MKSLVLIKENLLLLVAFTLPLLIIAIVAIGTYVPGVLLSTEYNFIYVTCDTTEQYRSNLYCGEYLQDRYVVTDGKLSVREVDFSQYDTRMDGDAVFTGYQIHFFLHDTHTNVSREITLDEVTTLSLNKLLTSPDGVTVSGNNDRNYSGDFFIFGGSSSEFAYYLTKGNAKRKINVIESNHGYNRFNLRFIGWVPATTK